MKPKPTLLLDCDGVLADFTAGLFKEMAPDKNPEDLTSYFLGEYFSPAEMDRIHALLETREFWASLPPVKGALEGVAKLREKFEIFVVSSPWISCDGWETVRREWLLANFGISHNRLISCVSKDLVDGDVFVDDKIDTVRAWAQARDRGLAILFMRPYNRDASLATDYPFRTLFRAADWDHLVWSLTAVYE